MTSFSLAQNTRVIVNEGGEEQDLHIKIGAQAGLTLAMNTTDYQVSRVSRSLGIGSDFGVRASIPIGGKTRFVAGVGYHTLSFKDENERISYSDAIDNHSVDLPSTLTTEGTFQYTVLTAMMQFSQFYIGVNIGLPASSEMTNTAEFEIPDNGLNPAIAYYTPSRPELNPENRLIKNDITPDDDDLSTLIELRLGGEFPIVKSPLGDLNFGISLGWTFNQILKDSRDNLPNMDDQFHLPNVMFNIAYLFNI
jgi:hypothetical protein